MAPGLAPLIAGGAHVAVQPDGPFVIVSGRADNPEAGNDCQRAGQNLMLSAHARGLGTCWVGSPMGWLRTSEGKAAIGIPDGYDAVAPVCLGYAAETPAPRRPEAPTILWT